MNQFKDMMEKAQALTAKMQEADAKLKDLKVEGSSGGGLVQVSLSGKGGALGVTIDPSLMKADEKDVLEDLLVAAFNDARAKMEAKVQEEMMKASGGFSLPGGMKLPGF